jgi:hypothetical protein
LEADPATEPFDGVGTLVEEDAEEVTYVLLQVLDEGENEYMAVFSDGSYTRWLPRGISL